MNKSKLNFIEFMIKADVLRFGNFVTKSGRHTPYFINTGNYTRGAQIAKLGEFYAELINDRCGAKFDAMFGPAYKGIPIVTTAAVALANKYNIDKPLFFNRKEAKDHGEKGILVGYQPKTGDNVIIIEDVITAGTAVRESMSILKNYDTKVSDMFISVNRCEVGNTPGKTAVQEVGEEYGIKVHTIVDIRDIIEYLKQNNQQIYVEKMMEYMDRYCIFE